MPREIHIRIPLTPAALKASLAATLLVLCAGELGSENVTLTTYYPAPSGVYTQMITTGKTILSRDGESVTIGAATPAAGVKLGVDGAASVNGNLSARNVNAFADVSAQNVNAAANVSAAGDVLVKGASVVTNVVCTGGIVCSKSGNTLSISLKTESCVPNGTCTALAKCGAGITYGQDNCGNSCSRTNPACVYACGSCTVTPPPGRRFCSPKSAVMGGQGTCYSPTSTYTYNFACDDGPGTAPATCTATNTPKN